MKITPGELLDTSIAQLQTLAAFLGDQLSDPDPDDGAPPACAEARLCRDVLVSLGVLIHRLQAARATTFLATRSDCREANAEPPGSNPESSVHCARRPGAQSTL